MKFWTPRKNLFALVPVGLVVILCLFVATRSEVRDPQGEGSDITVSNSGPAKAPQEVRSDSLEQRAIRSPSGRHVVYYGPCDPYKAKPDAPVFTVVDTAKKTDVPLWITVLTLSTLEPSRLIATRLKLDVENRKTTANLSWLSSSKIRVTSGSANWIIDIDSRSVVPQP
jgi:hypothetical protein